MITSIEVVFPETYQPGRPMTKSFRGAICSLDPSNPLLCHRDGQNNYIYEYPFIHYRWPPGGNKGYVVGFGAGASYLLNLDVVGKTLTLDNDQVPVVAVNISTAPLEFTQSDDLQRYRLLSPWLPFNQRAYDEYQRASRDRQKGILDRICRNHLVSAMSDLGQHPRWRVQAAVDAHETSTVRYKDTGLFAVWGNIICNINLPDGFAFGRKVSSGFGWVHLIQKGG